MLDFFIFGKLEDATGYFVYPLFYDLVGFDILSKYGYPFGISHSIFSYSEPVALFVLFVAAKIMDPVITYNIFIILTTLLAYISINRLISLFFKNTFITTVLPILYLISPYYLYNIRSHPQLSQVWILALFLYVFFRPKVSSPDSIIRTSTKRDILTGIVLSFLALTSNYLGFFALQFVTLYMFTEIVWLVIKRQGIKLVIFSYTKIYFTFLMISSMWLYPFMRINYIMKDTSSAGYLSRPIEDFVTFSVKPWYLFLPSADNAFLGNLTLNVINFLQDNWGYFLTQNYFRDEHSAVYVGIINIFIMLLGIIVLINNKAEYSLRPIYFKILLVNALLILFAFPPFFTINNINIYTPSYLIYEIFPMFRVLSRVGALTTLLNLILIGLGYLYLENFLKNRIRTLFLGVILYGLILLSILELSIPITVTRVKPIPPAISMIQELEVTDDQSIASFPYKYATFTFYWMRDHKKNFVNPKDFKYKEYDSRIFTNNLISCEGVNNAKNLGVKYILYYDSDPKQKIYFDNNELLAEYKFIPAHKVTPMTNLLFEVDDITEYPNIYIYEIKENSSCSSVSSTL